MIKIANWVYGSFVVLALLVFLWFLYLVFIFVFFIPYSAKEEAQKQNNIKLIQNNMQIASQVFAEGEYIPAKYTCLGEGINPPLQWSQVPANTKSLALIVDDPDATIGVFSHWVLWNIPVRVGVLMENSIPTDAVVGTGSSGANHYVGPCPPSGVHHYRFKLYALDAMLSLPPSAGQKDLESAMVGHILEQSELIGLFKK